jgi:hypothetical protein
LDGEPYGRIGGVAYDNFLRLSYICGSERTGATSVTTLPSNARRADSAEPAFGFVAPDARGVASLYTALLETVVSAAAFAYAWRMQVRRKVRLIDAGDNSERSR